MFDIRHNWGRGCLAAGFFLFSFSTISALGADVPQSYTIVGDAWTCEGRGSLKDVSAHRNDQTPNPEIERYIKVSQCMPVFHPSPVNVIAFLGEFAFLCDRLDDALGMSFYCTYALTADLRDSSGHVVPNHFSSASPSPHFFDRTH